MHARARAYKSVSFASEPIQPPIVPVKPFEPRELRSTARARERTDSAGARPRRAFPAAWDRGRAGAQRDEVGERAERGRQRAGEVVRAHIAATRRCHYSLVRCVVQYACENAVPHIRVYSCEYS
jgi:hypothetical protein